jgi:D-glycero-alpha-D-manno-heptose-7-phosphate kinase
MDHVIYRSRAPLRISFAGGGTDIAPYPEIFGGAVLSSTIDMFSYSTIKINKKKLVKIHSKDYDVTKIIKKHSDLKKKDKLFLVNSILRNLKRDSRGMDITLFSDAKIGSGLGASSAFTVALVGNLLKIFGINKTLYEIADLAYKIERIDCNIKGGYQDQYSATFGGFNFIEFKKNGIIVNPLRLRDEIVNEMLGNFILCDTGVQRKEKLYEKIIQSQSSIARDNSQVTDNLHKIKNTAYEMKDVMMRGNLNEFADLLHAGWIEKRKLNSSISTPKIDKIYELARREGVKGGKLLGAGGGGFLLLYCPMEKKSNVIKLLQKIGVNNTKFNFENSGLLTWKVNDGVV